MQRAALAALILGFALAAAGRATVAVAEPVTRDPAQAPAGVYVLDPGHAKLKAKISYFSGLSRSIIRFTRLEGGFTYDPSRLETTRMTVTVDARSIRTGLPPYDSLLMGRSFFNAASYPTITFVSTAVDRGQDGEGRIMGDLTLLGVTKPLTLEVTFGGVEPGGMGAPARMGFSGRGKIRRSDFGMKAARSLAGDEVVLDFDVEFVKK